jgi:hypothetical protein
MSMASRLPSHLRLQEGLVDIRPDCLLLSQTGSASNDFGLPGLLHSRYDYTN